MIEIELSDLYDNIRLDRYLRKSYALLTQGVIQNMLRRSLIKVNGRKASANAKLYTGDIINIYTDISSYAIQEEVVEHNRNVKILSRKIKGGYLLYENANILIINKPSNLSTQGGVGIHVSIDHALQYINQSHNLEYKLVHRLDKETSGVLIIAKNYRTAKTLGSLFASNKIHKKYIAVLCGIPKKMSGLIKSSISKTRNKHDKFIVIKDESGKEAITEYKILATNEEKNISLCLFSPITGRMHQLRHHANLIECSILGDIKYQIHSSKAIEKNLQITTKTPLMLHAYCVSMVLEDKNNNNVGVYENIAIPFVKAKLPHDMANLIEKSFDLKEDFFNISFDSM